MDTATTKKSLYIILLFVIFSATVVSECQSDVKLIFDEGNSPEEYFLYAFKKLNESYFISMYIKNESAHGYFKILLNNIKNEDLITVLSPINFCEQYKDPNEFILCKGVVFKELVHDDIVKVEDISGMDAFRHVYLTKIFDDIKVNILFPQRTEAILWQRSTEMDKRRLIAEKNLNNKKTEMIRGYFDVLYDQASIIARTPATFYRWQNETNEEFEKRVEKIKNCQVEIGNMYGHLTTSRLDFLYSLKIYNQKSFDREITNVIDNSHVVYIPDDDLVLGYFKDLMDKVSEDDLPGLSPNSYCFGLDDICLAALTKLGCEVGFSALQAFRHVYLTHIFSEIRVKIIFPEKVEGDVDINKIKIKIMRNYVDKLYNAAKHIDPSRFRSRSLYCEKVYHSSQEYEDELV